MGNVFRRVAGFSCMSRCFGINYKACDQPNKTGKRSPSIQRLQKDHCDSTAFWSSFASSRHRTFVSRNRIADYIAWALNRSRSPLLLDDALATTSAEVNSGDFTGINCASWISDGTASDASHALYREMDPYNYRSIYGSLLPSPSSSSIGDGVDTAKTGSWVAVTKLSGSKHQTTTSAVFLPNSELPFAEPTVPTCEEEVDGLELARLSRSLWPKGKSKYLKRKTSLIRPRTSTSDKITGVQHDVRPTPRPRLGDIFNGDTPIMPASTAGATRPTVLNLSNRLEPPTNDPLQTQVASTIPDSPVELFWDHEPGTVSPKPKTVISSRPALSPIPVRMDCAVDNQSIDVSDTSPTEFTSVNLYPVRPRRRTHNLAPSSAARPDITSRDTIDNTIGGDFVGIRKFTHQPKCWSYSDKLASLSTRTKPVGSNTTVTYTNLLFSPDGYSPFHPPQDLVDSGFVGLTTSSCAETTSDDGLCPMSDFLWDHELFEEPVVRRPRLNGTVR